MNIPGKSPWLTLHVSRPLQSETPLESLRSARVTDKSLLYVRNNQNLDGSMGLEAGAATWEVTLTGPEASQRLSLRALRAYPRTETEMVLQCAGNSRGHFSGHSPVSGAQWQDGAVANVVFGGVLLRTVLSGALGDVLGEAAPSAAYLTATGAGTPHEGDLPPFERSVPLAEVLGSALLATTLNGEALPACHGGPVRLVLPGFYGVNSVKWLTRLSLGDAPTENHYQLEKYRLPKAPLEPGQPFEATSENSVPSWRMKLRSLLWRPLVGETLRAGDVELGGVAWSDGRSRVGCVEISCDRGKTWHDTELEEVESPYAWVRWSLTLALGAGEPELWIRASDEAGNAQPLDPNHGWNPAGYEWHSVQRVRLAVR